MEHQRIVLRPPAGLPSTISTEVVRAPHDHAIGLSWRRYVPPGTGMLFVFDQADRWPFTMEHALVPLDMIFIDARGRVVDVIENAAPNTVGPYTPRAAASFVLELAGGQARKLGVSRGTAVQRIV